MILLLRTPPLPTRDYHRDNSRDGRRSHGAADFDPRHAALSVEEASHQLRSYEAEPSEEFAEVPATRES